jgi:hypothetical protein
MKRFSHWNKSLTTPREKLNGALPPAEGIELLLSDDEALLLLRAAQAYDDRALTRLYNLFADRVFRFIYLRISDRSRAEELTGEAFVRLLESIHTFRFGLQGHTECVKRFETTFFGI